MMKKDSLTDAEKMAQSLMAIAIVAKKLAREVMELEKKLVGKDYK